MDRKQLFKWNSVLVILIATKQNDGVLYEIFNKQVCGMGLVFTEMCIKPGKNM